MQKTRIIICSHDGIDTHYCGVGTVTINLLKALRNLNKRGSLKFLKNLEVVCISPLVSKNSTFYSKKTQRENIKTLNAMNGKSLKILTTYKESLSDINSNWGKSQWRRGSKEAARIINSLSGQNNIVLINDIYFAQAVEYLNPITTKAVFVPHSTGKLFGEGFRLPIERKIFRAIIEKGFHVGFISKFMRSHLKNGYKIPDKVLKPIINSLPAEEDHHQNNQIILQKLRNSKLIFTFGRCSDQKNLELIIETFLKASSTLTYKLVILAPTDISSKRYIRKIANLIKPHKNKIVWIRKFTSPIPFLRLKNLELIIFASRFECAPVTALETLNYAPTKKILYANIPPFREVFRGRLNTLMVKSFLPEDWASDLKKLLRTQSSPTTFNRNVCHYEENILTLLMAINSNQNSR